MTNINRHETPPGGWQYRQPQTGWVAPFPINYTFNQQVANIIAHRQKNKAISQKFNLSTVPDVVAAELERFNRKRLGLSEEATPDPFSEKRHPFAGAVPAAVVVAANPPQADRNSLAFGIKRAAQGTAVVLDWLSAGLPPVSPDLAIERAKVCADYRWIHPETKKEMSGCPMNENGAWYTIAPAEIIRETLQMRSDLKLETPYDDRLKSCHVCRCLNRLKVWCPISHIVKQTKPDIMAEFPPHCWIVRERQ